MEISSRDHFDINKIKSKYNIFVSRQI